jgi:hypothetical protein
MFSVSHNRLKTLMLYKVTEIMYATFTTHNNARIEVFTAYEDSSLGLLGCDTV